MTNKHADCTHNVIDNYNPQGRWQICNNCNKRLHSLLCGAVQNQQLRNKKKDCFCDPASGCGLSAVAVYPQQPVADKPQPLK